MINISEDIDSLTEFKKNTNHFILNLKKTGRPTVLTVNGKAELVVIGAAAYQKMQEQLELEATVSKINQSLKDFESGNFSSTQVVKKNLKKRIAQTKTPRTKRK
jgi:prevent-host-death family protein